MMAMDRCYVLQFIAQGTESALLSILVFHSAVVTS